MFCIGLTGLKVSATSTGIVTSLAFMFLIPLIWFLLSLTSDGIELEKCYYKAKKIKLYTDHIYIEDPDQSIPARQIKQVHYLGIWGSKYDPSGHIGINLAFKITFNRPVKEIGSEVYFWIRFPGVFTSEIQYDFILTVIEEMSLPIPISDLKVEKEKMRGKIKIFGLLLSNKMFFILIFGIPAFLLLISIFLENS